MSLSEKTEGYTVGDGGWGMAVMSEKTRGYIIGEGDRSMKELCLRKLEIVLWGRGGGGRVSQSYV